MENNMENFLKNKLSIIDDFETFASQKRKRKEVENKNSEINRITKSWFDMARSKDVPTSGQFFNQKRCRSRTSLT